MNFEDLIKNKLKDHEMPYEHGQWLEFQSKISVAQPSAGISISKIFIAAITVATIATIGIFSYMLINENDESANNTQSSYSVKMDNNEQIITPKTECASSMQKTCENKSVSMCEKHHSNMNGNSTPTVQYSENNFVESEQKNVQNVPINPLVSQIQPSVKEVNKEKLPNAAFHCSDVEGCEPLSVRFYPVEKSDSLIYLWTFGDGKTSTEKSPIHEFEKSGTYNVLLTVKYYKSKQLVNYTMQTPIVVNETPNSNFTFEKSGNQVEFYNNSIQNEKSLWIFGDMEKSSDENPEHEYKKIGNFNVRLITTNSYGCCDTIIKLLKIEHEYFMPDAFIPNGDGSNDFVKPSGKYVSEYVFDMQIFNKFGKLIFQTSDVNRGWDGKIQGTDQLAEAGVYAWVIITSDKLGNQQRKNGTVYLNK